MRYNLFICTIVLIQLFSGAAFTQVIERERPAEWSKLVYGGQFMDRFRPIPTMGSLTSETWGAENVIPRYTANGIEDNDLSYWGGNALSGPDGSLPGAWNSGSLNLTHRERPSLKDCPTSPSPCVKMALF